MSYLTDLIDQHAKDSVNYIRKHRHFEIGNVGELAETGRYVFFLYYMRDQLLKLDKEEGEAFPENEEEKL